MRKPKENQDVQQTRDKVRFVYLHIHVLALGMQSVECAWVGPTDRAGQLQLFSDVRYAHAFTEQQVQDAMFYLAGQPNSRIVGFVIVEANSKQLSPAMKKVLRV